MHRARCMKFLIHSIMFSRVVIAFVIVFKKPPKKKFIDVRSGDLAGQYTGLSLPIE